jgi:hypothetical protein
MAQRCVHTVVAVIAVVVIIILNVKKISVKNGALGTIVDQK